MHILVRLITFLSPTKIYISFYFARQYVFKIFFLPLPFHIFPFRPLPCIPQPITFLLFASSLENSYSPAPTLFSCSIFNVTLFTFSDASCRIPFYFFDGLLDIFVVCHQRDKMALVRHTKEDVWMRIKIFFCSASLLWCDDNNCYWLK